MTFDMTNCPKVPLPELLSFVVDNRGKTVPTAETGHVLIATNCIRNEYLYPVFEKVRYLSDETYRTWFRAHPKPGDVIFVNKGTPGRVCMVPDPVNFCIAQDMIAFRTNPVRMYNKYLLAVLRSAEIQTQIHNFNVGDVIPHFKKSFLGELLIPVPNMDVQIAIGNIYFDMSAKIDSNTKINHYLEQMARAIYNEALISNEGVDGVISDVAEINAHTYSLQENWGFVNYLDTSNITRGVVSDIQYITDMNELPSRARRKVTAGDIVFSTVRPNQCHYGLITNPLDNMLVSTGFSVIHSTNHLVSNEYLYLLLSSDAVIEQLQAIAEQSVSTYPSIKPSDIGNLGVMIPSDSSDLNKTLHLLFEKLANTNEENRHLAALRDTLLPRLMSGELSVADLGDAKL